MIGGTGIGPTGPTGPEGFSVESFVAAEGPADSPSSSVGPLLTRIGGGRVLGGFLGKSNQRIANIKAKYLIFLPKKSNHPLNLSAFSSNFFFLSSSSLSLRFNSSSLRLRLISSSFRSLSFNLLSSSIAILFLSNLARALASLAYRSRIFEFNKSSFAFPFAGFPPFGLLLSAKF